MVMAGKINPLTIDLRIIVIGIIKRIIKKRLTYWYLKNGAKSKKQGSKWLDENIHRIRD